MSEARHEADRAFVQRSLRIAIIGVAVTGAVLLLLRLLAGAFTPLAAAFVLAYLFDPLIDRFEKRRIGRRAAIFLLIGLVGLGLFAFAFLVVPRLIQEIAHLSANLPTYLDGVLVRTAPKLEQWLGIKLPGTFAESVENLRASGLHLVLDNLRIAVERSLSVVSGTLGTLVGLLVIPVIAYYLLAEFDQIKRRMLNMVPRDWQDWVVAKAGVVDRLVAGFVRGQLLVCLALGMLYATGFSAIGVDLAIGIGFAAGMLAIIPYVGSGFALVSASLLCVLEFGFDVHLALVVGWYVIVQTLEGFVLVPRIIGQSIGMHPVTVIVALLIGGDLLGFLGLIIAVPLAAVIQVFVRDGIDAYRRSPLYRGRGDEAPDGAPPV